MLTGSVTTDEREDEHVYNGRQMSVYVHNHTQVQRCVRAQPHKRSGAFAVTERDGKMLATGVAVASVAAGGAAASGVPAGATRRTISPARGITAAPASTRRRSSLAAGSSTATTFTRLFKPSAGSPSRRQTSKCTEGTWTRTSSTSKLCGRRSCVRGGLGKSFASTAGSGGRFRSS